MITKQEKIQAFSNKEIERKLMEVLGTQEVIVKDFNLCLEHRVNKKIYSILFAWKIRENTRIRRRIKKDIQ